MAESQNYLAAENAARQRARGARRNRMDEIIDPLVEAGRMDRLQDTSVSDFAPNMDAGSMPIVATVGRGGGTPVQNAGMFFNRRAAPMRATPSAGGCPNGQCGIPQPMTASAPMVSAPAAATTVANAPQATSRPSLPTPDALMAEGLGMSLGGLDMASVSPAQAAYAAHEGNARSAFARSMMRDNALEKARQEQIELTRPLIAADTAVKKSEADLNLATAKRVYEATQIGQAETAISLLDKVASGNLDPKEYARIMTSRPTVAMVNGKEQVVSAGDSSTFHQYAAQGRAALAVKSFLTSPAAIRNSRSPAADEVDIVIGKDEKTGAPVEQIVSRSKEPTTQDFGRDLSMLVSSYRDAGLIGRGKDWNKVSIAVDDDIRKPLEHAAEDMYMQQNAGDLAKLKAKSPDFYEEEVLNLRERARDTAGKYTTLLLKEMEIAHAKDGGSFAAPAPGFGSSAPDAQLPMRGDM